MRERPTLRDRFALQTSNLWWIDLGYTLLWSALLVWARLDPASFWFTSPVTASRTSQVMCACAMLTPFFIPFVVYFPISKDKRHLKSFSSLQLSSSRTMPAYLQQVASCFLLTLVPVVSVYVLLALTSWFSSTNDLVPPIIPARSFLTFLVSLALFTSTTSVGLAMSGSRVLHLVATAIAASVTVLPFLLSKMVTGTDFLSHLVRLVQTAQASTSLSLFLAVSSLLLGSLFFSLYGREQHTQSVEN